MVEGFVPVRGDGFLLRYNSRLPVVVYVPDGVEVRYRVWAAGPDVFSAVVQQDRRFRGNAPFVLVADIASARIP